MKTVAAQFLSAVDQFPERVFLREIRGRAFTYGAAARRIAATARSLVELGARPGDRIVCYLEELVPATFMQLACSHIGVAPVHLPRRFAPESAIALARRVTAFGMFVVAEVTASDVRVFTDDSDVAGAEALATAWSGSDVEARTLLGRLAEDRKSDDVYQIQPTSGTTGNFNLVVRTHEPIQHTGQLTSFGLSSETPIRISMTQPLTHGPGHYTLCSTLQLGAEGVIPSTLDTKVRLDDVRALDPMIVMAPVRVLRALFDQYGGQGRWLGPSTAFMVSGAAAPDPDVMRLAVAQGIDLREHYGMVETGSLAMTERGAYEEGVVGKVLPDVEVKNGPDGELLVRSPRQMLGYFGDPALTASERTPDGFFHTRDFGELLPDGRLLYLGRKKDRFNTIDGSNIHPGHIEQQIETLPWVEQIALVGDMKPYVVALLVVRDDGADHGSRCARAREDLRRINAALEQIEQVRRFVLLDRPMGADIYKLAGQGKIGRNRQEIQRRYQHEIERLYSDELPPEQHVPSEPTLV